MNNTELRNLVRTIIETRIRETDITDGTRVSFGSPEHVTDLEMRISDLERWRDRQRRGSEARANYARLIGALKRELRAAVRVSEPKLVEPDTLTPEMHEADGAKKVVHWEHTRGTGSACGKSGSGTATRDKVTCSKCKGLIAKERKNESVDRESDNEDTLWVVFHQYMGQTIGFAKYSKTEAQQDADARNRVARLGAWGRQNPDKDPPYIVVTTGEAKLLAKSDEQREEEYWSSLKSRKTSKTPFVAENVNESVDMEDPEYASIEDFAQFLIDEDRFEYTHEDLAALNFRTRMPIAMLRKELESYGLKLAQRAAEKQVRGFSSNSHDRWFGKGSQATHGGAGIDSQTGRATSGRGDI